MFPPSTPPQQSDPPSLPIHQRHLTDPSLDFSPSKALQHQQTTQSWSQVLTWLSTIYSRTPSNNHSPHPTHLIPQIERNDATLTALQALMNANLRANQRRKTLHEARTQQLRLYEKHSAQTATLPSHILLQELKDALPDSARDSLHAIASTAVTLDFLPPSPSESSHTPSITTSIGTLLIELTQNLFVTQNDLSSLVTLRHDFEEELIRTQRHISDLQLHNDNETTPQAQPLYLSDPNPHPSTTQPIHPSNPLNPSSQPKSPRSTNTTIPIRQIHSQTTALQHSTRHLLLKIGEYEKRISALQHDFPSPYTTTLESLHAKAQHVQRQRTELRALETRLTQYHGLPPDVEASRSEVRRAEVELQGWRRRREEMFEGLGGD